MWWTVPLAIVKKIPWQLWLLGAFLVYTWGVYSYGQSIIQSKWDASIERGKAIVADLKEKQIVIKREVEIRYVDRVRTIHEVGKTIIKEIPIYIPADTPDLPAGFRVLHDAAATGTVPGSFPETYGSPIRVEDATETIAKNYGQCLEWRTGLIAWQEWYSEQSLAWQIAERK